MIDWNLPVCTSHETPFIGYVMEDCPIHGKKRVATISPSLLVPGFAPSNEVARTIWRYDEDGSSRGSGEHSDYDLVNYDSEDGRIRVLPSGQKIVCGKQAA